MGGGEAESAAAFVPETRDLDALAEAALAHETKEHLYELAQEEDIAGRSSMGKAELAAAVGERLAHPEAA